LHTPPFPCAPLFRPPATPTTCTSTPSLHNALPISFRTQKLLGLIQARVDVVDSLYAEFMHFVDVSARPEPAQLAVLNRLLQYGPQAKVEPADGVLFLVVPRPGTISPWSSKATDIAHNCGLPETRRIERGIAYYVRAKAPLKTEQRQLIANCLHDRM